MKSKKMMIFVLCMVLGGVTLSACASTEPTATIAPTEQEQANDMVRLKEIFSGSYSADDTFRYKGTLYQNNGKYINFWIDNTGDKSITITIDGKGAREIEPGKNGHISAKVGMLARDYEFMATPTSDSGGTITFDYRIKQRDTQ